MIGDPPVQRQAPDAAGEISIYPPSNPRKALIFKNHLFMRRRRRGPDHRTGVELATIDAHRATAV
jgi:hypothetical protein